MKTDFLASMASFLQQFPGGEMLFTTFVFVVVLSVLVFVHEWGHYAAARSVGVRVVAFSIGFGRRLLEKTDKHGTRWQIAWIPLGGYVQLHGQEDGKPYDASTDDADSFMAKSVLQRAWIIVAGPLVNIVFAFVLLLLVMLTGDHKLSPVVGEIMPQSAAEGVLLKGDRILSVNSTAVAEWDDVPKLVKDQAGQPLTLIVQRNEQQMSLSVVPQTVTVTDIFGDTETIGRLGVGPSMESFVVYHGPLEAVNEAAKRTWEVTWLTLKSLYKLLTGAISADNLAGPLGIADMAGQTAANGMFAVLMFMAIISINLGIINLFPLPVLDGGHLVFLAYEGLRGKPVSETVQAVALRVGLVLIVMLAVFATFNDLKRFGLTSWLADDEVAAAAVSSTDAPTVSK